LQYKHNKLAKEKQDVKNKVMSMTSKESLSEGSEKKNPVDTEKDWENMLMVDRQNGLNIDTKTEEDKWKFMFFEDDGNGKI